MSNAPSSFQMVCPIPLADYPAVVMGHGGGGRLMRGLIEGMFLTAFPDHGVWDRHDSAVVETEAPRLAFTTDTYVVRPLFFPGGDIGSMAVYGTSNDLAMSGARVRQLSVAFVLEEGLPMETLWRIVCSIRQAADRVGAQVVTGDTKVVERGHGDGIYVNTAGIGPVLSPEEISPRRVTAGDAILLSGDVGRHGIAVIASREGIGFETTVESDLAPVVEAVARLIESGVRVHCLRDLTRGGLSAALNEIADGAGLGVEVEEAAVAVRDDVAGACELLGFDPMAVANEGRFVAFVAAEDAEKALTILRETAPGGASAAIIGRVAASSAESAGGVTLVTRVGTRRALDMLSGEQLPRIC